MGTLNVEMLYALLKYIPVSVYFMDRDGRFVAVSRAKAEHSGTTVENMLGKTDFDFLPEAQAKKAWTDNQKVMETGECYEGDEQLPRIDGSEDWVSVTKAPWIEEGEIVGVIGITINITQQKKAENHNVNVTQILKHDAKNRLLEMGYITKMLLKKRFLNPELALQNLFKKIIGAEKIISDCVLIDGKEVKKERCDLSDIVDSVFAEYQQEIDENEIFCDNTLGGIPAEEVVVEGERLKIGLTRAGLRNTIGNSIKHSGKGFRIAVGLENLGTIKKINVYNSGKPIPREYIDKLFEPGFSGGKGSGMGLYLIRNLLRNIGGDILYQPTREGHTNFIILIPL